ncbi:MAG: YjjG family noncanonical pyrimidine nucleotidase [Alphaproteobacteria bacterium]|nr:YjjG family noncanonical pyrimidine nucleotidase [Alphaproteobacteria bacterium]
MKKKYKNIFFDLDNTLVDFKTAELESLQLTHKAFYQNFSPEQDFKDLFVKINRSLWKAAEEGKIDSKHIRIQRFKEINYHLDVTESPETIAQFYLHHLAEKSTWLEEAKEALKALSRFYKIAVITNGFTCVQRKKYALHGMDEWVSALIISEETGFSKPDKRIFDAAFKEMNCTASDTLMVGDSLFSDYQGAINAGMDFCWINPEGDPLPSSFPKPKYEVKSVAELLEIL